MDKLVKSNDSTKWAVFKPTQDGETLVASGVPQEKAAALIQSNPGWVARPVRG